jgi:hypothetical protein
LAICGSTLPPPCLGLCCLLLPQSPALALATRSFLPPPPPPPPPCITLVTLSFIPTLVASSSLIYTHISGSFLLGGRAATNIYISDVWSLTESPLGVWTWLLLSPSSPSQPSLSSVVLRPNGTSSSPTCLLHVVTLSFLSGLLAGTGSVDDGSVIIWVFNPIARVWYVHLHLMHPHLLNFMTPGILYPAPLLLPTISYLP